MDQIQLICEPNNDNFSFFLGRFYQLLQSYFEVKGEKFDYKRQFFSDSFQTILIQKAKVFNESFFIGMYSAEMIEIYSGLKKLWGQIQEDIIPSSDIELQLSESDLNTKMMFYLKKLEDLMVKVGF